MEKLILGLRRAQEIEVIDKTQTRAAAVPFRDDVLMSSPPSYSAADFEKPRLGRCHFDPATINWRLSSRIGGGLDGYIWKVWFEADGPYALKVFWDADPPNFHHYFAAQRECQNAALLQMLETAIRRAPAPIVVNASPRTKDDALANLRSFSDEGRQMNTSVQGAHVEEITKIPRIRKCYGWTKFSGQVFRELPIRLRPPVLNVGKICRAMPAEKEYTAIVYEYVEEGENHPDVVEEADKFFWLTGFTYKSRTDRTEILKRSSTEAPYLFWARRKKASPPKRKRARDQQVAVISLSSTVAALIQSYSSCNAEKLFGEEGYNRFNIQQGAGSNNVFVKIFLAINRSDEKIEIQQIYRRFCCYVFAKLHQKHKSIDPIVQEIENALPFVADTRIKVYHHLRIGAKWATVLETFSPILVNHAPQQLTGILCLLGSPTTFSEDASILLAFLSVLAVSEKVPLDLLSRGATPRRRWNMHGEMEEVDTIPSGLVPELCSLLSGTSRLSDAFHELELSSAVSKNIDETYTLDEIIASRIRVRLSPENRLFYRSQALVVVYRAIPWKYIEPVTPATKLFLPHVKYVLQTFHDHFEYLPAGVRADLVLTLLEASRFPNMAWKRFVVDQAELAALGLEGQYIHSLIAQSRCLLNRISGTMNQTSCLDDIVQDTAPTTIDNRMHSIAGQASIQRSLNCIQTEDLSTAKRLLNDWSPLDRTPSSLERVVEFRKNMMLGRILRYQGAFKESLTHLQRAQTTAVQENDLIFDEDFRDLTCDLADTLRELNEPASGECHLRIEITRRDQNGISTGKSLLEISLAEALFAQARYREAESICLDVQSRPDLLKLERLRLHITMAKIRHVEFDNDGAFYYWKEAMKDIAKLHMTGGRTTRTILISICDTLRSHGQTKLMTDSMNQVALLDGVAKPEGVEYWIAGLRHWSQYLDSRTSRSHM
ncbi:hypothetical protein FBULB1_7927 [Fusarium bulbicola]|nr:hypothetical protein FBULB1_7927 [Fusarium bulbicola]